MCRTTVRAVHNRRSGPGTQFDSLTINIMMGGLRFSSGNTPSPPPLDPSGTYVQCYSTCYNILLIAGSGYESRRRTDAELEHWRAQGIRKREAYFQTIVESIESMRNGQSKGAKTFIMTHPELDELRGICAGRLRDSIRIVRSEAHSPGRVKVYVSSTSHQPPI